jgi:hypothetical protein
VQQRVERGPGGALAEQLAEQGRIGRQDRDKTAKEGDVRTEKRGRNTLLLKRGRNTLLLKRGRNTLLLKRGRNTLLLKRGRNTLLLKLSHDQMGHRHMACEHTLEAHDG